jgi:LPXTG-motif cell wall-anchored protein
MTVSPDPNTVTITNTVTCDAKLTLVKDFDVSYGAPEDTSEWTLTASGPTTPISGTTGQAAVTNRTVSPGAYELSESGPDGYIPSNWVCLDGDTAAQMDGDTVTVPIGGNLTCTITNSDKPGSVKWNKVATVTDELLEGSEWKIVGPSPDTTETTIVDCVEETAADCEGSDQDPDAGEFLLEDLHWGSYTVTETKAPPGYVADATFTFTVTYGTAGTVIDKGDQTNAQQAPVELPMTGGLSTDLFTGLGIGIVALAAAGYWWIRTRRKSGVA